MRNKPLAHIEEEVMRYRQLVQGEMRAQMRRRHAANLKKRFSGAAVPPRYYNTPVRAGLPTVVPEEPPLGRQLFANSTPPSPSQQERSHRRNGDTSFGNRSVSSSNGRSRSRSGNKKVSSPGSLEASLALRRQQRVGMAVQFLGSDVFVSVYNYYRAVEVAERDATRVMQMVPDRSHWHVLPLVEEVVLIDRLLERVVASGLP
ncbi:putative protein kinase [Trypanosoma grayi]|uniref:putative protein kinase n=1 Tax=Trypanosoma grayi TaxID=71804 RepID=UPI0004F3EF69|nr:putative protein kinase [Trypanosoma grayi]KEG07671.1 putative protein kinase [Trypanosoma grayi]